MTRAVPSSRAGFSLVEVLVAMVLVALLMAMLFPITFKVGLQSRQASIMTQRTAVISGEMERLTQAEFTTLTTGTTCQTFSSSHFPHVKCITVSETNPNRKVVTVTVTPSNGSGVGAASSQIERSRGSGSGNPLNTP